MQVPFSRAIVLVNILRMLSQNTLSGLLHQTLHKAVDLNELENADINSSCVGNWLRVDEINEQ